MMLDTRRTAIFDAETTLTTAQSVLSLADRVDASLAAGAAAAQAKLANHTSGDHVVRRAAAPPIGVEAGELAGPDDNRSSVPQHLGNFVAVSKEGSDASAFKLHVENGRYEVVAPSFSTLVHRNVLARGKWMFEVTLHSDGLFQIGWSPPHDRVEWTSQLGVGDFVHSIAYDGVRRKVWRGGVPRASGTSANEAIAIPQWCDGDVITACIDLDAGSATFYSNGRETVLVPVPSLPTARADDDDSLPYFLMSAAVSIGRNEYASINMGDAPFAYPRAGYAGISWMTNDAEHIPRFLRAHVAAETAVAVSRVRCDSPAQRNLALARLVSRCSDIYTERLFGAALVTTLLQPASQELPHDQLKSFESLAIHEQPMLAAVDILLPVLSNIAPSPSRLLREIMVELGHASRSLTLDVPSTRNVNRRAKAALRLAGHVIAHYANSTPILEEWPAEEGTQLERDLTPFTRPRFASPDVQDELIPEVDLIDPLNTPGLRDIAQQLGNDLYLHVQPDRERVLTPLVRDRPWVVMSYISVLSERQDAAATSGTTFFALLAGCLNRHIGSMSDEQLIETYSSRETLACERAAKLEPKRLGGSVNGVLRRCKVSVPRHGMDNRDVNPLLIAASWLFHATARRHLPAIMRVVSELQSTVETLKKGDSDDTDKLIARINELTRKAVLSRGRMSHEWLIDTLVTFWSNLARIVTIFEERSSAAVRRHVKNVPSDDRDHETTLRAGVDLITTHVGTEQLNYLLLPVGFATSMSIIMQICRRSMPLGFSQQLVQFPHTMRAVVHAAMNPIIDSQDSAEQLIQLASLALDPPSANPIPHCRAIAAVLSAGDIALLVSRCFNQLHNDMAWSISVNLLACVGSGCSLATQRPQDANTNGWTMWNGEQENAEVTVPAHEEVVSKSMMTRALRMLDGADRAKERWEAAEAASASMEEKRKLMNLDLVKGFKILVARTIWLHTEFGVAAQDELSGRGNPQSRNRMSIIFDLLQRCLQAVEFFLEAVGDMLLTTGEKQEPKAGSPSSVPTIVQQTVECITLILREYGSSGGLMYTIAKAPPKECQAMQPWRLVGPAVGALLELIRPDEYDAKTAEPVFAPWKRVFHRMLSSPRCSWDMAHIEHAVAALNLPSLIDDKKVSAPQSKVAWLTSGEWRTILKQLYENNRSLNTSKRAPKDTDTLASIGKAFSTASLDDFDDTGLCTICYVDPVSVTFRPCGHQSCHVCIERQLEGENKRCFFCNAAVGSLEEVAPKTPGSAGLVRQGSATGLARVAGSPTSHLSSVFPDVGEMPGELGDRPPAAGGDAA